MRRLDIIAYAMPIGWMIGRLGCTLAHDHRGLASTSWIAVNFPEGPRYDLGLIEFLFLIGMVTMNRLLDRRPRPVGFFFGIFGVVYGGFRIWLDTLHLQPNRFLWRNRRCSCWPGGLGRDAGSGAFGAKTAAPSCQPSDTPGGRLVLRSRNNIPWLLLAAHMVLLEIASAQPLLLPHWSGSFDWEGQSYSYTLIGASPAQGSSTTHIPVNVIPVRVLFSDGSVFDPMDPFLGSTALDFALHSPIFQPTSWTAGSVDLGTTQFGDAIQRANFWNYVSTVAPDYHVLLDQPKILSPILLTLPPQSGLTVSENGTLRGILDYNWLRQSISSMAGTLDPASLTIFLVKQVSSAASIQNPSSYNCSFHSSLSQANAVATYMFVSIYDEAHCNGDVHSFSHEVAEWLNDPLVTNVVPAWSIGADEGTCSNVLEAGDPLEPPGTKTTVPVTLNGVHYTLQETAFLSYFARAPVSSSVNGWYTFQNSYPGYSPPCAITSGYNFRFYDYAGAAGTAIMAINGQDEFAGSFYDGATNWAFAAGGPNIAAAVLKPFNAAASVATGLNDRGEVVGYYSDGTDTYGFIYSAGSFQIVQFPIGALSTVPLSINDADQIVGYYIDLSGKRHGFMLANGSYTTIDPMIAGANRVVADRHRR